MSFSKLSNAEQRTFAKLCTDRRKAYEAWTRRKHIDEHKDILIVADRPGPKAPQTDDFHHTPFYSKIHSGGFLNAEMVRAGCSEHPLMWTNSATWDGKLGDTEILAAKSWAVIITLGKNAERFIEKNYVWAFPQLYCFDHPQYHKRFKSTEPYPLIEMLQILTKSQVAENS